MKLEELRAVESVRVFKNGAFVGLLSRTGHGAQFRYDDSARRAMLDSGSYGVSFTLPPTQEVHQVMGTNLHPFFAGLLPEGLRLKALRQSLKTSEDDLFSMLLALGSNCIGDVYVKPEEETDEARASGQEGSDNSLSKPLEVASLEETSFFELFERSITDPNLSMREIDSGVPGVIPKLSASMISFPVRMRKRNREYLLKLGTEEHPLLVENEHFFMRMAAACGFAVSPTAVVRDREGVPGLLVERFDRLQEKGSKSVHRLHQEDACQFLGRYPQDKYRLSLREIAVGITEIATSPIIEIRKLIELYLFGYLVGNGDIHAKNISLLEDRSGRIRLSPVYDMLSTLPYGDRKMALRLGAKDDNFSARDIVELGKALDFPARAVEASIERLLMRSREWIARFDEIGFGERKTRDLQRTFEERAKKLES